MDIEYRKLTADDLDVFIQMRINQLREEGAKEDIDLTPALRDYYHRHMSDGTFVSWLAIDGCGTVQITASDMGVKLYSAYGFVNNGNFMQYKL